MSVNKVTLIGYLGRDPESKALPSGDTVTSVTLATSEQWKDKHGAKQERTAWFNLAFFGKLAEVAAQYLSKGSLVYAEGQISARAWISKHNGEAQASLEVRVREMKMLGGKKARDHDGNQPPDKQEEFNDDIPF